MSLDLYCLYIQVDWEAKMVVVCCVMYVWVLLVRWLMCVAVERAHHEVWIITICV